MEAPIIHHHHHHLNSIKPKPKSPKILTSCLIATLFLTLVVATLTTVFLLFRPQNPHIAVDAVRLPSFSSLNGSLAFTFAQHAAVRNPNRDAFSHYDSDLRLVHRGAQLGFIFIPAGQIDGGRTQFMAASFSVNSFPAPVGVGRIEVESRMSVRGRVRVLGFFTHHVETTAGCFVGVSPQNGQVLDFRC